ncbi:putative cyclin [Cryptosporidium felis]|nr:putative cyclin [Cryptosporidium felis]
MLDKSLSNLFPMSSSISFGADLFRSNGQCNKFDSSLMTMVDPHKPDLGLYISKTKNVNNFNSCGNVQTSLSCIRSSPIHSETLQTSKYSDLDNFDLSTGGVEMKSSNTEPGFVIALSIFLTQIATSNSSSTNCNVGVLTPFHSVCIPPIPIRAYLLRIAQHFGCSNECFVLAIIYVGRIIKYNRNFTLTLLNVHRVIVTAIMLATKFFDDIFYSNAFYAKVSGVGTQELNSLEIYFLRLIRFQLFVTEYEYEIYKRCIVKSAVSQSALPSFPVSILNKQMSYDARKPSQLCVNSAEGRRISNPLSNNLNCTSDYYTLNEGQKDHCSRDSEPDNDYHLRFNSNYSNIFLQPVNNSFNVESESFTANYDICSNNSEIYLSSNPNPLPRSSRKFDTCGEKYVARDFCHNEGSDTLPQHVGQCTNTSKIRDFGADCSIQQGNKIGLDFRHNYIPGRNILSNINNSASTFHNRIYSAQATNTKYTYDTYLNKSSRFKDNSQIRNISRLQFESCGQQNFSLLPYQKNVSLRNHQCFNDAACEDLNTIESSESSTSNIMTASAVSLVNPTINHYGRHVLMNPCNFRCTTGIDRRLLV